MTDSITLFYLKTIKNLYCFVESIKSSKILTKIKTILNNKHSYIYVYNNSLWEEFGNGIGQKSCCRNILVDVKTPFLVSERVKRK